jgi:hypothetical protein
MNERAQTVQTVPATAHGRRLRLGAIAALALLAGFVAWLVFKGDDNKATGPVRAPAAAVTYAQLRALPAQVGHDVYWAGKKSGYTYELTQTSQGNVFVRYLPAGVQVNDSRPNFLTVGSYPRRGAYASLKRSAKKPGAVTKELSGGGIAVYSEQNPTSVYAAYPGKDIQVEVYDPSARRAQHVVFSGQVRPVP